MKRLLIIMVVVSLITIAMTAPPVVQTAQASSAEICYWAYWSGFTVTTWTQLCFAMAADYYWDGDGLVQALPPKQNDKAMEAIKINMDGVIAILTTTYNNPGYTKDYYLRS